MGQCPCGKKKDEQVTNKEMAKNGGQVEGQIVSQRLLDCIAWESVESEAKRDDSE